MIQKVKDDSLASQAEQMKDTIEKLEKAKSKEDIRKVLDASGLDGFAKDEIDQIGNTEIFDQEKKDLDALRASGDEEKLDTALQDSLLDEDYQKKL